MDIRTDAGNERSGIDNFVDAAFAYAMLSFTGLLLSRYRRRLERQLQD